MCGGVSFNNNGALREQGRLQEPEPLFVWRPSFEDPSAAAVQWEAAPLSLGEMSGADRRAESGHVCTPLSLSLVTPRDNTTM